MAIHPGYGANRPTPEGGSRRLALTAEDTAARGLFLRWCEPLGLHHEQDAIGNMFLRRTGADAAAPAVAFGSHLDTVPTGGRFHGVAGVLAGLEVLRVLHDAGTSTKAPLELVNWMNEEGSRFRPAMMGSRVAADAFRWPPPWPSPTTLASPSPRRWRTAARRAR